MKSVGLVWYRNDLRVADHEPLVRALKRHDLVIPLYVFDPRVLNGRSRIGRLPRFSAHRFAFLEGALRDLAQSLESLGGKLATRIGEPERVIPEVCADYNVTAVYFHEEVTSEEKAVELRLQRNLEALNISIQPTWNSTLAHKDDLPFSGISALPDVFTSFRVAVEKACTWRAPVPPPVSVAVPDSLKIETLPKPEDFGLSRAPQDSRSAVMSLMPGETGAWKRLDTYIWESQGIKTYKETRNGLVGADYSSK